MKIKEDDRLKATVGGKPSVGPRSTAANGKWPRRSGALQSDFAWQGMVESERQKKSYWPNTTGRAASMRPS